MKERSLIDPTRKPFRSDGCSGALMWVLRKCWRNPLPWEEDCKKHDRRYWGGGTAVDRVIADLILADAIQRRGYPWWARVIFIGVSIGGHPLLPFPWRWNYGRPWPEGYARETAPSLPLSRARKVANWVAWFVITVMALIVASSIADRFFA